MSRRAQSVVWLAVVGLIVASAADAEAQRRRRQPPVEQGPGHLNIETAIEGAEVLVDEETAGYTPLDAPILLSPGSHTVRVRRGGYTEFATVVEIAAGGNETLQVDMMALAMVLTVRTTPEEASVFVDGTFRGTTPLELELNEGDHSLRITAPRHHEVIREITAQAGQTDLLSIELEPLPPEMLEARPTEWYEEPLTWILVGAGVVAVTVAVVIIVVVLSEPQAEQSFCGMGPGGQCDATLSVPTRADSPMGWEFDLPNM
ncbi:MAG: PEGA domain-containing protein [Sandaracinaceae bacterium]|nr:PEGA domain-containing protein [Sandaracinaceae bacterium]